MTKKLLLNTVYISILLLIIGCAQTKLADYQPKSTDEEEVLNVILEEENALKNKDLAKLMHCYHDNATISLPTVGRNPTVVSKQEFEEYLKDGGWASYHFDDPFLNPKITISGNEATLKCSSQPSSITVRHTYNLIKENEKWYITNYDYRW